VEHLAVAVAVALDRSAETLLLERQVELALEVMDFLLLLLEPLQLMRVAVAVAHKLHLGKIT
jgi:hypothetical protein